MRNQQTIDLGERLTKYWREFDFAFDTLNGQLPEFMGSIIADLSKGTLIEYGFEGTNGNAQTYFMLNLGKLVYHFYFDGTNTWYCKT